MPTPHQIRVREFMKLAGQDTPDEPTEMSPQTRVLRSNLILEEALETIEALGVAVYVNGFPLQLGNRVVLRVIRAMNWINFVDGCADISVVTTGSLVAAGVDDEPVLEEVDKANLRKFGPGSYRREDGKWMKPPDFTPPDIESAIAIGDITGTKVAMSPEFEVNETPTDEIVTTPTRRTKK